MAPFGLGFGSSLCPWEMSEFSSSAMRFSLPNAHPAGEADLRSFLRIFVGELQRGFFEKHIWLSLWDRPPRSRFTRVQRASCCCLLVFLFLCANAVWYGVVGDVNFRCAWGSKSFQLSSLLVALSSHMPALKVGGVRGEV